MTDFERRVEIATAALCSRSSSPETRRKMRRYARRVVRALDEAQRSGWERTSPNAREEFAFGFNGSSPVDD